MTGVKTGETVGGMALALNKKRGVAASGTRAALIMVSSTQSTPFAVYSITMHSYSAAVNDHAQLLGR